MGGLLLLFYSLPGDGITLARCCGKQLRECFDQVRSSFHDYSLLLDDNLPID